VAAAAALLAAVPDWVANMATGSRLEAVLLRVVPAGSTQVEVRRPPREARAEISKLLSTAPDDAELLALRARQCEQLQDSVCAEADWRRYGDLAADKQAALLELADYYHRRLEPAKELDALSRAASLPSPAWERLTPVTAQRSWGAYQRIFTLIDAQGLAPALADAQYRAWQDRYADRPEPYRARFAFLLRNGNLPAAEGAITAYARRFTSDPVFPVTARAQLARRRGGAAAALEVYDRAFDPLWPPELVRSWFDLLRETQSLRTWLAAARAAAAVDPDALEPAARTFFYYQQQGNLPAAVRVLLEYRMRKESRAGQWTAAQLYALSQLFEGARNYDEAARSYYALYALAANGDPAWAERALYGLASLLLSAPEQPVRFGQGDLSYYRDIGALDAFPGFLNGVLSLVLNSSDPPWKYSEQERKAPAYFHRARASELVALFEARFPASERRAVLSAMLIDAYAAHGADAGVIARGALFLQTYPRGPERTTVALQRAEAFARLNRTAEEFAEYESLLKELSAQAENVPLGAAPAGAPGQGAPPARSPGYARVLDRYISRLLTMNRAKDALALYRREIDRNPDDPGLYERLAGFLEQNKLTGEIESVYRRAMGRFQERSWHHKLARHYLRLKQGARLDALAREVAGVFSGSELQRFVEDISSQGSLDPVIYRQVNLYAHQRFPRHTVFVKNLLRAYQTRGTADPVQWESLLRRHWYHDDALRAQFFEFLSRTNRLEGELAAARAVIDGGSSAGGNPAIVQWVAEAEAWKSHFERAAPLLRALSEQYPGDSALAVRTSAVHRSLAAFEPKQAEIAAGIEQRNIAVSPRDAAAITRLGEIHADAERFDLARPVWNRVAAIEPGKPQGYLEAATVFWDYHQFGDALRMIGEARQRLAQPALFAFEAGAIHENRREYGRAIEEYVRGALASGGDARAQRRLITLAGRAALGADIEQATAQRAAAGESGAFELRLALLEAQRRRGDIERLLLAEVARAAEPDALTRVDTAAARLGFDNVSERSLERQIAISRDPVDKMSLRLALARFQESRRSPAAAGTMDALYADHKRSLGVVRSTVDYHWRNKNFRRAIAVLLEAAGVAHGALGEAFTLEAARKSIDCEDYTGARKLLDALLAAAPFNSSTVALYAESYARQRDDRALAAFYTGKIRAVEASFLDANAKKETLAAMRRGLIPALHRLGNQAGAVDQYVEILNRYPEDEALAREAARYAAVQSQKSRLLGVYARAEKESPKDFRWPLLVARLETAFEDYPAAISAYTRAGAIRPDRTDVLEARVSLEERLFRFDDAYRNYGDLYVLTYRNPVWLEKQAEVRARQEKNDEAVRLLREALIEGRPPRAAQYALAVERLSAWRQYAAARKLAEEGLEAVDPAGDRTSLVAAYARALAQLRQQESGWEQLASLTPELKSRALEVMCPVVESEFSLEEKGRFGEWLANLAGGGDPPQKARYAERAGAHDSAASIRVRYLMAQPGEASRQQVVEEHVRAQRRRLRFDELGGQLEAYWKVHPPADFKSTLLEHAGNAYRAAGNQAAELRVLSAALATHSLGFDRLDRFFELIIAHDPARIEQLARQQDTLLYSLVNYCIRAGKGDVAVSAVAAHSPRRVAVWQDAYRGLLGLYFRDSSPEVKKAFLNALDAGTVGDRVGKAGDRDRKLAGDLWFYYGSRFGEYLAGRRQDEASDYLPAGVEGRPASASAHFDLGVLYDELKLHERALAHFDYAGYFDASRGDALDRAADLLWQLGRREDAAARWRGALAEFRRQTEGRRTPETFWRDAPAALQRAVLRGAAAQIGPEIDRLLEEYVRRNGAHRAEALFRPFGADAAIRFSRQASDPAAFLHEAMGWSWIEDVRRPELYDALLAAARERVGRVYGQERSVAAGAYDGYRLGWVRYLIERRRYREALAALRSRAEDNEVPAHFRATKLEVEASAGAGTLQSLIDEWAAGPALVPPHEMLLEYAAGLRQSGDDRSANLLLAFAYPRELDRNLNPSTFLGYAELKLAQDDTAAALALLRRMTLVSPLPFETQMAAARLLISKRRPSEAAAFLEERARAVPWDGEARRMLEEVRKGATAAARPPGGAVPAVAADPASAPLRIEAFRELAASGRLETAVAAAEPLLEQGGLRWVLQSAETAPQEPPARAVVVNEWTAQNFLQTSGLDANARAQVADSLASAYRKLGRLPAARFLYLLAANLASPRSRDAALAQVRAVEAEMELRWRNRQRAPVVSERLEQANTVRPLLAAGGAQ
jgi:hypothetical protein